MRELASALAFLIFACADAQVKVLFDASKAETSGNADWVIDADQHNLGFFNGPAVLGQSDESNAQRIPTAAQSSITANTGEAFWSGGISAWGVDCVKQGYVVETLPYNGAITYGSSTNQQDLSHYNVFIVCEPNIRFTAAERDAIVHFVQNGGGLFMVSDHDQSDRNFDGWDSPGIWNDLMTNNTVQTHPFGIVFDLQDISQTSNNIPTLPGDPLLDGPMGAVTQVLWSSGTTMTIHPAANASVKGVAFKNGSYSSGTTGVMCAYASFGSGRVAAIGDSSPCEDGTGDANDVIYNGYFSDASGNHQRLLMNATIWLAGASTGVSESIRADRVMVFPNPSSGQFTVRTSGGQPYRLLLLDGLGRVVRSWGPLNGERNTIDAAGIPSGVYRLEVTNDRSRSVLPLVVE